MPLTSKGNKIKRALIKRYGKEEGTKIFYKSENAGRITGVHREKKRKRSSKK